MDKKHHSRQVTIRFLQEVDRITGRGNGIKVTATEIGEKIGIRSTNITRMRNYQGYFVTVDACCRLCENYGTDPSWLLLGTDEKTQKIDNNMELRVQKLEKQVSKLSGRMKQNAVTARKKVRLSDK